MTDFYTELKLSPDSSLQEIQSELLRQEQLWRRREINSPETATAKLVLINEAKKVFTSESSRAKYNRDLENSKKKPVTSDLKTERYQQYKKWYDQALVYAKSKQWDLAKTAIEKALSFIDTDSDDSWFYNDAANIYRETKDYSMAMTYINKAIVIDDSVADFYITKGLIYTAEYEDENSVVRNREKLPTLEVSAFRDAVEKAKNIKDTHTLSIAYGLLAYCYSRQIRGREEYLATQPQTPNEREAKNTATLAVKFGDSWDLGKQVLDSITLIENRRKEIYEEKRRKEEEYRKWENQDIFESLTEGIEKKNREENRHISDERRIAKAEARLDFTQEVMIEAQKLYANIRSTLASNMINTGSAEDDYLIEWAHRDSLKYNEMHSWSLPVGIPMGDDNRSYRDYITSIGSIPRITFQLVNTNKYFQPGNTYIKIIELIDDETDTNNTNRRKIICLTKWGKLLFDNLHQLCEKDGIDISLHIYDRGNNGYAYESKWHKIGDICEWYAPTHGFQVYIHYKAMPELITQAKRKGLKIYTQANNAGKEQSETSGTPSQKQAAHQKHGTKDEKRKKPRKVGCLLYMVAGVIIALIYIVINLLPKVIHG